MIGIRPKSTLGGLWQNSLGVLSAPLELNQNIMGGSKTLLDTQRLKLQKWPDRTAKKQPSSFSTGYLCVRPDKEDPCWVSYKTSVLFKREAF